MMEIAFIVVPLALIAAIFGLVRYHLKARSSERLAMIQAGLDIDHFENNSSNNPILLQLGLVTLSISIGISVGGVFSAMSDFRYSLLIFMITISFSLSIGLILCYIIQQRARKKRQQSMLLK